VRVDLARCAMWFMSLGTFDKNAPTPTGEQHQILVPDTITAQTPYGELVRLAPPVKYSETKSPTGKTRYSWCAGQQGAMEGQLTLPVTARSVVGSRASCSLNERNPLSK
jgi:hypothetical protein